MKEFIEKLIDRLEEMRTMELDMIGSYCQSTISKSISIVNELAEEYNNEVCEWTEYDYKTIRSPHERDWSIPSMKDFKYCPYCRKKIKVVE